MSASTTSGPKLLGVALLVTLTLMTSTDEASAFSPMAQAAGYTGHPASANALARIETVAIETSTMDTGPLTIERLTAMVEATWPEDPETATRILICESHAGEDPDTYNLDAANGGPMQLNRYTWEPYFEANYAWTWEQIVTDIDIHLQAARHIYDRAGDWSPWRCY